MSGKVKYPRSMALEVARELVGALRLASERIIVAGSLRRRKSEVGDVEIVYIPRQMAVQTGLFETDTERVNVAESVLEDLLAKGVISKRLNTHGSEIWGERNKLARHNNTGIPVDLFSIEAKYWWNYVVCRTGSAETNIAICNAAIARGWQWKPYRGGFLDENGNLVSVCDERNVFETVGLKYLEPWER